MKKLLIGSIVCLMAASTAFAADTYTGALLELTQKKIDAKASPLVEKERALQAKQKAAIDLRQKQEQERQLLLIQRQQQLEEQRKKQQELIDKKKQQIQAEKDMINSQKSFWKSLFSFN